MIRSELLKLKSSPTIYLLVSFTIFEIASTYGYLYWHRNLLTYKNIVLAFALAYPSLISVITNICFEQEREANNFQEVRKYSQVKLLTIKTLILDLLLWWISFFVWWIISYSIAQVKLGIISGIAMWLLIVLLNHSHMFLYMVTNKYINLVFSLVEILFIIFASNKTLMSAYWCFVAWPINYLIHADNSKLYFSAIWILILTILDYFIFRSIELERID